MVNGGAASVGASGLNMTLAGGVYPSGPSGSIASNDNTNWFDTVSQNAMRWYDYLSRRGQETSTPLYPVASVPGGGTLSLSQPAVLGFLALAVVAVVLLKGKK